MFCPKCGSELKPGTKFCNKCGTSQEVPSSKEPVKMRPNVGKNPPKVPEKKKGKGCLIALIAALVVVVLLGAGGFAGYKLGLFDRLLNQETEETDADNDKKDKKNSRSDDDDDDDKKNQDKKEKNKKDEDDEDDMTTDSLEEEESGAESTEEKVKLSELVGGTASATEAAAGTWTTAAVAQAETTAAWETSTTAAGETTAASAWAETTAPTWATTAASETPAAAPAGNGEYILPDSSSRRLTEADLAGLNKEQLKIARNEIYARHGRMFNSEELQFYFNSKSWYHGTISPSAFSEDLLSQVEKDNVQLIIKKEESMP